MTQGNPSPEERAAGIESRGAVRAAKIERSGVVTAARVAGDATRKAAELTAVAAVLAACIGGSCLVASTGVGGWFALEAAKQGNGPDTVVTATAKSPSRRDAYAWVPASCLTDDSKTAGWVVREYVDEVALVTCQHR
ncbi:hypothetical protein OHA72_22290 [Dactylosporangium sp. NBC_01737]|uniref:hypothetical protein n=1 Tax=Dactylosporangium sp. NBC_01737 TaxID=2975959 RepID=UPI002E112E70|nr:hypothetical protein OHA72_22290 [Dactylosporangium sp. NBC_01737]